jgi:hypothetical protein
MSTENKKKVLLGFGAFAVVLIAVLAIWRPPAFRSEDASGSIGAVQKHHAPQITQKDVILGDETTRHEQQIRYADFLDDAAKLRALSAKITANNFAAASNSLAAMRQEVQQRYVAAATEALAAAQALARETSNRDSASKISELSAILQNSQLSDAQMESFNRRLAAFANQAGMKSAAERANAAKSEVDAAIAEMRTNGSAAQAKMESAASELRAMNAITLSDRLANLNATEVESKELARDSEVLGKMASRPVENVAAARAFDGTASQLEMMAGKNMESNLGLLVVIASALRDIDANITAARGVAVASVAGRSQAYDRALENARQAFAGTRADFNAHATAGINAQLNALNGYFTAARAGSTAPQLDAVLANLSQQVAGNTALGASLAQRQDVEMRMQQMASQKNAQKNAARN